MPAMTGYWTRAAASQTDVLTTTLPAPLCAVVLSLKGYINAPQMG